MGVFLEKRQLHISCNNLGMVEAPEVQSYEYYGNLLASYLRNVVLDFLTTRCSALR